MPNTGTPGAAGVSTCQNFTEKETCLPDGDISLPPQSWGWHFLLYDFMKDLFPTNQKGQSTLSEFALYLHWTHQGISLGPRLMVCGLDRWVWAGQTGAHSCVAVGSWPVTVLLGNHSWFPEETMVQQREKWK